MYKTRQKIGREQRRNVLFLPLSLLSKFHDLNMNKAFYLSQPLLSFTKAFPVYVLIHILPKFFSGAPSKNPQQLANSCNPNKCLNNAQCIEGKSTFFCVCPPNTSGRLCEKKTTPTTGTTIVVDLWYG